VKGASLRVALPLLLLACLPAALAQPGISPDSTACSGLPSADELDRSGGTKAVPIGWRVQCLLDTMDCDPCGGCCCGCGPVSFPLERLGFPRNASKRDRIIYRAAVSASASFLTLAVLRFLVTKQTPPHARTAGPLPGPSVTATSFRLPG
jgi:hypothetical protein